MSEHLAVMFPENTNTNSVQNIRMSTCLLCFHKIQIQIGIQIMSKDENIYDRLAIMFPENCRGHLGAVHYAG